VPLKNALKNAKRFWCAKNPTDFLALCIFGGAKISLKFLAPSAQILVLGKNVLPLFLPRLFIH
jgi:hypothetical protein